MLWIKRNLISLKGTEPWFLGSAACSIFIKPTSVPPVPVTLCDYIHFQQYLREGASTIIISSSSSSSNNSSSRRRTTCTCISDQRIKQDILWCYSFHALRYIYHKTGFFLHVLMVNHHLQQVITMFKTWYDTFVVIKYIISQ